MSCARNSTQATRAAARSGINPAGSKTGYTAASTAQVSFFGRVGSPDPSGRRGKRTTTATASGGETQVPFFGQNQTGEIPTKGTVADLSVPSQRQLYLRRDFSPEELDKLLVKLHLGAAATARHVSELSSGQVRDIGHGDPRPLDWARLDQQQYDFLIDQLRRARRGQGYLDARSLKKKELVELWAFARFEADRTHRNIDHLTAGLSHLKGPTADYLVAGHRLEARFYTFLAEQLETIIPQEVLVRQSREVQFEEGAKN
ncbi:MAG: hypothetical protein AB1801_04060 [Chloroflexota bacterium]